MSHLHELQVLWARGRNWALHSCVSSGHLKMKAGPGWAWWSVPNMSCCSHSMSCRRRTVSRPRRRWSIPRKTVLPVFVTVKYEYEESSLNKGRHTVYIIKSTYAGNDKVCPCSITKNPIWPFDLENDDRNVNSTLSVFITFAQVNLWPSSSSPCCSWPTDLCESQTACSSQSSTSPSLMWKTQSWR